MTSSRRVLFLSLRPEYAAAILAGSKTVEVRRNTPKVDPGCLALLYAATPIRQVVGSCIVDDIVQVSRTRLWRDFRGEVGLTRRQLNSYLIGAPSPSALVLRSVQPLITPVALEVLRASWEGFHPPQSYRFVSEDVAATLLTRRRAPALSDHHPSA